MHAMNGSPRPHNRRYTVFCELIAQQRLLVRTVFFNEMIACVIGEQPRGILGFESVPLLAYTRFEIIGKCRLTTRMKPDILNNQTLKLFTQLKCKTIRIKPDFISIARNRSLNFLN